MTRREEIYVVAGIFLAALSCLAAWLALPQAQGLFSRTSRQPADQESRAATPGGQPSSTQNPSRETLVMNVAGQWGGVRRTDDGQLWRDYWVLSQNGRYVEGTVRVEIGNQPHYVVKQVQGFVDNGVFSFNEVAFL